jgi:hypothetical protein
MDYEGSEMLGVERMDSKDNVRLRQMKIVLEPFLKISVWQK